VSLLYLLTQLGNLCLPAGQVRIHALSVCEHVGDGRVDYGQPEGRIPVDRDVRNGYDDIKVTFHIDADASKKEIEAIVAQSQKRSAVYDALTNPTNVTVAVA
jgi:hypothetical protein